MLTAIAMLVRLHGPRTGVLLTVMICAFALALSACGKKGSPEPPEAKKDQFPRQYPDPSTL